MILRKIIAVFSYLIFQALTLYAQNPSFHLVDPYLLKANTVYIGFDLENAGLKGGFLNLYSLGLNYGINDNIMVSAFFPYLTLLDAADSGCFGDVSAAVKFSLAQGDDLSWRLLSAVDFRFPTGVIKEDSTRSVHGNNISYYPFTTGSPGLAPSLIASFLLDGFACNLAITYLSENSPSENVFTFNLQYDRIDLQLSADYLFKVSLFENSTLNILPAFYLEYKYNLSKQPIIPSGFYSTIENQFKLDKTWKLKISFSMPMGVDAPVYNYLLAIQLGRYF